MWPKEFKPKRGRERERENSTHYECLFMISHIRYQIRISHRERENIQKKYPSTKFCMYLSNKLNICPILV